jgi:hypothetical protein
MSETHTLAVHLEHHAPASYLSLSIDARRRVEVALLAQVRQRIPKALQEEWLDPAKLDIKPTTSGDTTSFTLDSINALFGKAVQQVGQGVALAGAVRMSCRHCQPYHCDRVCRDLTLDGAAWVVSAEAVAGDATTRFSATVGLEFEFPSGN